MEYRKFSYSTLSELREEAAKNGAELPLAENLSPLAQPIHIGEHALPNRLAIQPMEGCDGTLDGAPGELTLRRYHRFAESGASLIWEEATAILHEGRANPRQLMLTEQNLDAFKSMVEDIKETSLRKNGFAPLLILQATHSGRYSKPDGKPAAIFAYHSPIFEKEKPLDDNGLISDDHLKELEEYYGKNAHLAEQAGFDGVDVKACHRYLISETLSAFTRPGPYGGSFENRTRFFRNALSAAKAAMSSKMILTSRMNLYDGFAYPYGWGVSEESCAAPDLRETIALVKLLRDEFGIELLDYTIGNPYFNPHVNRPCDVGPYALPESPLTGVARMCACIAEVKAAVPEIRVISSGNSYLRQFAPNLAAGMLENHMADMAGFGRMAFAYPEFASDILKNGALDPKKCCITCSKCTQLMRAGSTAGCVIRDAGVYMPIYKRDVLENPEDIIHKVSSM